MFIPFLRNRDQLYGKKSTRQRTAGRNSPAVHLPNNKGRVHLEIAESTSTPRCIQAWRYRVWLLCFIADGGPDIVQKAKGLESWLHQWSRAVAMTTLTERERVPEFEWRTRVPQQSPSDGGCRGHGQVGQKGAEGWSCRVSHKAGQRQMHDGR